MAAPIERIVDAHIHLWDPANAEWYPYLAGQRELDMGDISGMCRLLRPAHLLRGVVELAVVKFVHVAAATAPHSGDETGAPAGAGRGRPVTPTRSSAGSCPQDPIADTERAARRADGVAAVPRHPPDGRRDGRARRRRPARARRARPDLRAHGASRPARVGRPRRWPTSATSPSSSSTRAGRGPTTPEERALWERGITALAALGDNVHCKLSGLAMPLHSNEADGAPAVDRALPRRRSASTAACSRATSRSTPCTAPSTSSTARTTAPPPTSTPSTRDKLFAANAERLYRC